MKMNEDFPPNLTICDPRERLFPTEWKESFFRRNFNGPKGGYVCPDCGRVFTGTSGLSFLEADHIVPFSRGGSTVWKNLVLRCKQCNIAKSDMAEQ